MRHLRDTRKWPVRPIVAFCPVATSFWFAEPAPPARPLSPTVHLLQGYDQYVVGYSQSKYQLDAWGAARSLARRRSPSTAWCSSTAQVAGHWKRTVARRSVLVEAVLYVPFDDGQAAALQAAAHRYAAFLGVDGDHPAVG